MGNKREKERYLLDGVKGGCSEEELEGIHRLTVDVRGLCVTHIQSGRNSEDLAV